VPDPKPVRVERFCKTTRWFHWSFVGAFLTLAASGAALLLRDELGLAEALSLRLVSLHEGAGLALVALPFVVLLSGRTGETWRDLTEALRWTRDDLRWLALQPAAILGRAALPPAGKLNAGQKLNALATAALAASLVTTGAWLWMRPGALVPWFVHNALFVLWIPAFLGHVFLAVVNPGTRPALRGMVLGSVDREWAVHHHGAWIAALEHRGPRQPASGSLESPAARGVLPLEAAPADGGS
jgi:formate dehydrogenase subunit gamma